MSPSYPELYKKGKLAEITDKLLFRLSSCDLCPRNCGVNRANGELGFCKTGRFAYVSSCFHHFGEEPELVGQGGSGTIFFSYCNLGCVYCQNHIISHQGEGKETQALGLAKMMMALQRQGAENINFVTPTHVIGQILEGLCIATDAGLDIPLVYNCGGYESEEVLGMLEGVFDIYMPDIKYSDNQAASQFSGACDYWEVAKKATLEMHRQVGDLVVENGLANKGLLIRHLVLPEDSGGSFKVLDFIKESLSANTYINIMDQYHPCNKAFDFKQLSRRLKDNEYSKVTDYAKSIGLSRGF